MSPEEFQPAPSTTVPVNPAAQSPVPNARLRAWLVFLLSLPYCLLLTLFEYFFRPDFRYGPVSSIFYDVGTRAGLPFLTWLVMRRQAGLTPAEIGFVPGIRGRYSWGKFILLAVIGILCCRMSYLVWAVAWNLLGLQGEDMFPTLGPAASPLAVTVYILVVGPLAEETLFRGVLGFVFLANNRSAAMRIAYVLVSSLLFGVAHVALGWAGMITVAYVGAVLALLFVFTRNIWLVIIPHFIEDFVALVL